MAKKLLLDTSFLMRMFQGPLKLFERIELELGKVEPVVSDTVLEELKRLASSRSVKKRRVAQRALAYIEELKMAAIPSEEKADDAILHHAVSQGLAVATLDQALIKKLRGANVTVVTCKGDEVVVEGSMV